MPTISEHLLIVSADAPTTGEIILSEPTYNMDIKAQLDTLTSELKTVQDSIETNKAKEKDLKKRIARFQKLIDEAKELMGAE